MKLISVKAPARICLFGDHQDYLGLPVIACAIDRYIFIEGQTNSKGVFTIQLKDLEQQLTISINEANAALKPRDYYRSSLRVLARHGIIPDSGYDITLWGEIPINAGISSSSALTVAWITFLIKAFGRLQDFTAVDIGHLAFLAESIEHNEAGGKMDQYTSAVGGTIQIETDKDKTIEKLEVEFPCVLICESGDLKDTLGGLANLNSKANEAINLLRDKDPFFTIKLAEEKTIEQYLHFLPETLHDVYKAAVLNHQITQEATQQIKSATTDFEVLGQLMTKHHIILKDYLKLTTPKIDQIIEKALQASAYGAKIIGSGGGGCVCILCESTKKETILAVLKTQVGAKAYEVKVSKGAYQLNL